MLIQGLSFLALIGTAIASGYSGIAWQWMLIPAFLCASTSVANGPAYDMVMKANREGRRSVFPITLGCQILVLLPVAFLVRWIASLFA